MIAYSSWLESQDKILDGKDILDNYKKVKNTYIGYFKNVKTGEELPTPRTDVVDAVCSSVSDEFKRLLEEDKLTEDQAQNLADFFLDSPIENMYATLIKFNLVANFSKNKAAVTYIHGNKTLIERCLEAKKSKDSYKASEEKKTASAQE